MVNMMKAFQLDFEKLPIEEQKEANKELVERYPFLLPHNRWTDKVDDDYDYSYTELEAMPEGWRKAFGFEMLEEIRVILLKADYLDKYRIVQIKEKFGDLRWYDDGAPDSIFEELEKAISKYSAMSLLYCIYCGKPTKYRTRGWINYVCPEHVKGENAVKLTEEDIPGYYSFKDDQQHESVLADQMRKQWCDKDAK